MSLKTSPGFGRAALPVELVRNKCVIGAELGVQKGEHAEQLLAAGVWHLYMVDLWSEQANYFDIANVSNAQHAANMREAMMRVEKYPFKTTVLVGPSALQASKVADGTLDFIYVDADHKLASVRADLAMWYPKVRSGGMICGHDFLDSPNNCGSEFGVATAVTEFCERFSIPELFVCQDECWPNWHFVKP